MQLTINRKWALVFGALLALPTAYFILINLLNEYGYPYLSDAAQPVLQPLGIGGSIGFNINLLILFGPLVALFLNLAAVLKVDWYNERQEFSIKFSIEKHLWNMMLVFFSAILLAVLFFYAIGENCHC